MANTNFISKITTIAATWLNQVNMYVYGAANAAALRTVSSALFTRMRTIGYSVPGKGSGDYYYDPLDTTTVDNGVTCFVAADGGRWKLLYNGRIDAAQGGVVTDGVTDDAPALQGVMNLALPFTIAPGRTAIGSMVSYVPGTRMYGENWGTSTLNNESADVSELYWIGASNAPAMLKIAGAAIGTMPPSNVLYMNNCDCVGIALNGNGKAVKGIYGVGCWFMNRMESITVTGTTGDAFWFALCWGGSPEDLMAIRNQGCGITLGRPDYGWSSSTVEQSHCINFYGEASGCDSGGNPLNVFNETTNQATGYGIGVFGARGLMFSNPQASLCDGAGVYLATVLAGSTSFYSGYLENNALSSASTAAWNIWVNGDASGNTANIGFYQTYMGGTPAIRLTGTQPSRIERFILFDRIALINTVRADWSRYKLINCDRTVTIVGTLPTWFGGQDYNARSKGISAAGNFTTSAGALSAVKADGAVHLQTDTPAGLVRNSAGNFTLNWSETYTSGEYRVFPGAMPAGWAFNLVSKTTTSYTFTITNSGTPTDPTFQVDWGMMGDYT